MLLIDAESACSDSADNVDDANHGIHFQLQIIRKIPLSSLWAISERILQNFFAVSVRHNAAPLMQIGSSRIRPHEFFLARPPDRSFAFAQVVTFLKNVAKVTLVRLGDCVRLVCP